MMNSSQCTLDGQNSCILQFYACISVYYPQFQDPLPNKIDISLHSMQMQITCFFHNQ